MRSDSEKLRIAIKALAGMARQCDDWAKQSRSGGWSTHQVKANEDAANTLRRLVDELSN